MPVLIFSVIDDCDIWFPCKAFFMLPYWHTPDCRFQTDESSTSVYVTNSGQVLLFDAKEIQDVQLVANPSWSVPSIARFQLGDAVLLNKESGRNVRQDGRDDGHQFPAPVSLHASLSIEIAAQSSGDSVTPTHIADGNTARGWDAGRREAGYILAGYTAVKSGNSCRCDHCGMHFRGRLGLAKHVSNSRSVCFSQKKCRVCEFQCDRYQDLDKHGELQHEGKDEHVYVCMLCDKGFKKRNSFLHHQSNNHR